MIEKYKKAYVEVLEILNHLPKEEYLKIPREKIDFFEKNKDKGYDFKINTEIDFEEQNLLMETEAIMVILFRDYFATEKQKSTLNNLLKQNYEKKEKERYEKYNPDNIFNNKNEIKNVNNTAEYSLMELREEPWYKKILNYFKKILKNK